MSTYQSDRPTIPQNIRREIKVEAGHKCSVTTCNEHTYLEIHHINQNREDNRKENLILLCDKHHKMAHAGEIDRKAQHKYKEILRTHSNSNEFVRGQEGERVNSFIKRVQDLLSYNYCGQVSWVGSETGYWFEQEVYINLIEFFHSIDIYNRGLRSYDQSARDRQDRIVDLLQQILNIREQGNYRYNGGYCATFIPKNAPGTFEYDNKITTQKKLVKNKLLEIQKLVFELCEYVENRLA